MKKITGFVWCIDDWEAQLQKKEGSMSLSRSFVVLYIYFCELSDRFLMNIDCVYVYNDFLGYMLVGIYPVMEISLIEREYI